MGRSTRRNDPAPARPRERRRRRFEQPGRPNDRVYSTTHEIDENGTSSPDKTGKPARRWSRRVAGAVALVRPPSRCRPRGGPVAATSPERRTRSSRPGAARTDPGNSPSSPGSPREGGTVRYWSGHARFDIANRVHHRLGGDPTSREMARGIVAVVRRRPRSCSRGLVGSIGRRCRRLPRVGRWPRRLPRSNRRIGPRRSGVY